MRSRIVIGSSTTTTTSLLLLGIIICFANVTKGQNTTVMDYSCNQNTWGDNEQFGEIVDDVLDEAVAGAPADPNYIDYSTVSSGDNVVYGYAECNEAILMYECYDCLTAAHQFLINTCGDAIGGEVEMVDCKLRYEDYDFYPN